MKKGFSLIELMVSVAIVGIVTAISFVSFSAYSEKAQLDLESKRLATKMEEIRMNAFAEKVLEGVVPASYGLYVADGKGEYFVYGDINGDCVYDAPIDKLIEKISLENKIEFNMDSLNRGVCFRPGVSFNSACLSDGTCGGSSMLFFNLKNINKSTGKRIIFYTNNGQTEIQ